MHSAILAGVETFALLLTAAVAVGLVARLIGLPYSVALVFAGLIVAAAQPDLGASITPDLVLAVLLPGLVFAASYHISPQELRLSFGKIALLAGPGVLLSAVAVAGFLAFGTGMPFELALVVGAIVSATDPVAVIATFQSLGAPRPLSTLVETESLLNDGTAIVLFAIAIRAVAGGTSIADGVVAFVVAIVVSTAIGTVVGAAASWIVTRFDDRLLELTISVVVAYGTYLIADRVGQSGVIATVAAGIVFGWYGRRLGMTARTQQALDTVWEFVAFLLNALVFLLVGLAVSVADLRSALPGIVFGVIGVLVGRAVLTYLVLGPASRIRLVHGQGSPLPLSWLHVVFWSGLRGAVAMALALSLPLDLPQRDLIQGIVFGIVLATLVGQGLTIRPLVQRLGLASPQPVTT